MQADLLLNEMPLVAILRGVLPEHVVAVADVLYESGIRAIEVPLNSPNPFASIAALTAHRGSDCLTGAGTVLAVEDVRRTQEAGGTLIVAPNCDADVISESVRLKMHVMPGIATATEAFAAIRAGATDLKLFPAITYGPQHLKALGSVLPKHVRVFPVGGVSADRIEEWLAAGAAGFGFGSELFRPNYSLKEIEQRARRLIQALHEARRALTDKTAK